MLPLRPAFMCCKHVQKAELQLDGVVMERHPALKLSNGKAVYLSSRERHPFSIQHLQRYIRILHLHLIQQDPVRSMQHHPRSLAA